MFIRRLWMPNVLMTVTNPIVQCPNPNIRKFEVRVPCNMGKIDIRNFLESVYDIRVTKVNTMIVAGKWKRNRFKGWNHKPDIKKAIVTYYQTSANQLLLPPPTEPTKP
jgi:ribosomal protein L23